MTSPVPQVAGTNAVDWLLTHRRRLVDAALAEMRPAETPQVTAQLRWLIDVNIGLFSELLADPGRIVDEEMAADLVASAATRAGEGSPIENLLQDYISGIAGIWRAVVADVRPGELDDLAALTTRLFEYLRSVTSLVVRGFQHEAARISIGERDARFALYSALLTGAETTSALHAVAPRYLVLALHLGHHEESPGPSSRVPSLRRITAVQRLLAEFSDGDVLALIRDPEGTALIPLPATPTATEADDIRRLVTRLADALGSAVHAGAATAPPDGIPATATLTEEILELVLATGRSPGVWFLDDVLVPYQLTRPGPARDLLATRMRTLDAHPDWEATLRAFLASGYDRRRTAEALHVHPNTVDYRLDRIATTCGFDAADPGQRPAALAALAVLDLERHRAHVRPIMS
ncbi:PucR family transcriptional regulator [Lentzea sp. NPDC092896]|uniref:PucR family transcriptional regulator n=1 Tax=Lentzea sp. NPDC092896 TaxID=3364127 RepID=UPI0037FC42C4